MRFCVLLLADRDNLKILNLMNFLKCHYLSD